MTRSLFALLVAASVATAGEYNKVLSVGDKAPAWEGLEGTDGKNYSLSDLKGKDVVVVVFTCNTCPVAASYEDRIIAFAQPYAKPDSKVAVVAINVNTGKEEEMPAMKKRAEKKRFPYPYLSDPSQVIAKSYGARYTPEFFVLDKDRKVVYMGAMDQRDPPAPGGRSFLEEAVDAALAGRKPATKETLGRGCMIKFLQQKG